MIWTFGGAFALLFATYSYFCYTRFEQYMGGQRLSRENINCPSNRDAPDIRDAETNRKEILNNCCHSETFETDELLHYLGGVQSKRKKNNRFRESLKRSGSSRLPDFASKGFLSNKKATELDMDHIYVSFADFLWA